MFFLTSLLQLSFANCPTEESIQGNLTCSSTYFGMVDASEDSQLGGECADGGCYTCGEPWNNQAQIAPEAVYSFHCQQTGTVLMEITDLPCDLDIYILDETCNPNGGCVEGSTQSFNASDSVEFECIAGENYYVVVEAYGTSHLDIASGPCTDDGTSTGNVISPTYTLSFDVSQSTGCAEDCDNGLDDDLDGIADCADDDCWTEPLCCDLDGDGNFAVECLGTDCDDGDPNTYTGAPEDGSTGSGHGDGIDNDCDGLIDEGTLDYDDDGDGFSESDGDCDDSNASISPSQTEIIGNNVDDDCNGLTDAGTSETDDDGDGFSEEDGDCDDSDATIAPNVAEIEGNDVDDDCDGETDEVTVTETENDVNGQEQEPKKGCSSSIDTSLLLYLTGLLPFLSTRRRR